MEYFTTPLSCCCYESSRAPRMAAVVIKPGMLRLTTALLLLPLTAGTADDATVEEGRRLSSALWFKQHPYARPPPPSPPPLDSLTGDELDSYLASAGVQQTKLAANGFDGAAVEELLHTHTLSGKSAVDLLQEPVPGSTGKRLAVLHWLHALKMGRPLRQSATASSG